MIYVQRLKRGRKGSGRKKQNDVLYISGIAAALRVVRGVGKHESEFYLQRFQKRGIEFEDDGIRYGGAAAPRVRRRRYYRGKGERQFNRPL